MALENLSYLQRKGAPIILKYKTLIGKRESGRLRNSNSCSLSSLGISQWQTQQLICAPAKNCLLTIVTVQGLQCLKPSRVAQLCATTFNATGKFIAGSNAARTWAMIWPPVGQVELQLYDGLSHCCATSGQEK